MVGQAGVRVAVRHLPHHNTAIEVFGLDGVHLGSAVLAEAASEEQVKKVRTARTAKARRLRADMKAAERLRRERFKAVTTATPPERLGALTEAEAEAELADSASTDLRRADPGYIPHQPVPDGWARPVPPAADEPDDDTPEENA